MPRQQRCTSFNFSPTEWRNDARVLRMTAEERGAYIGLITAAWEAERPGFLPDCQRTLAHLAMCSPEEWERVAGAVYECFSPEPGFWVHNRVVRDYAAQNHRVVKRKIRAKTAARKRWAFNTLNASAMPPSSYLQKKERLSS